MTLQTNRKAVDWLVPGYIYSTNMETIKYYVIRKITDGFVHGESYKYNGENWEWRGKHLQEGEIITEIGKIEDHPEYFI